MKFKLEISDLIPGKKYRITHSSQLSPISKDFPYNIGNDAEIIQSFSEPCLLIKTPIIPMGGPLWPTRPSRCMYIESVSMIKRCGSIHPLYFKEV